MKRRALLTAAALLPLARPSLAQNVQKLIFVPQGNLVSLDPVWTTASVTRNFSSLVYDTLYGLNARLEPHPQMAEGHTVSDDGLRWTVRLREGLRFHDNEPVLARSFSSRSGSGCSTQSTSPVSSALAWVAGSGMIRHSTRSTSARLAPAVKSAGSVRDW